MRLQLLQGILLSLNLYQRVYLVKMRFVGYQLLEELLDVCAFVLWFWLLSLSLGLGRIRSLGLPRFPGFFSWFRRVFVLNRNLLGRLLRVRHLNLVL